MARRPSPRIAALRKQRAQVALAVRRQRAIAARDRAFVADTRSLAERAQRRALRRVARERSAEAAFLTLGEAQAALQSHGGLAAGLAIGLGAVAVAGLGLVVAYLLFRPREPARVVERIVAPAATPPAILPAPAISGYLSDSELPYDEVYGRGALTPTSLETRWRTIPLPLLSSGSAEPVRLATGPRTRDARVTVRVVGPPGTYGVFALSFTELQLVWPAGVVPAGDTLVLPAGDYQRFRLQPGQAVYGKGSAAGVSASVVHDAG